MKYFDQDEFNKCETQEDRAKYLLDCKKRVGLILNDKSITLERRLFLTAEEDDVPVTFGIVGGITDDMTDDEIIEAAECSLQEKLL